ncbi:hypothetical protein P5673_003060 [Acropora cervicornis]|uniref:Uncharacterized protein n=1 Tax=Acropora cervicornis TaxID=6130 RepID=A0AAD9R2S6_ACRCE|nr:hypothetical protein P5673_003060 [Acropora cervicornis]
MLKEGAIVTIKPLGLQASPCKQGNHYHVDVVNLIDRSIALRSTDSGPEKKSGWLICNGQIKDNLISFVSYLKDI